MSGRTDAAAATPPRGLPLALRYTCFAAVSGAINILVQVAAMALYQGPFALTAAMAAGTLAGLVPKYVLDKVWIFYDRAPAGAARTLRQFVLYTLLSVATTLLFWAVELAFDRLGGGDPALRYLGAAIGLGLGYWAKYHLDRRFVFAPR